jgi:hypothetical protein
MLRIKQLVPTVALTLATAALVTPAAQARLADVSAGSRPQSVSTRAFSPVHRDLPHWGTGTFGRDFTAGRVQPQNSPLKNQLSIPADAQTSVSATSTGGSVDWTAAAVGAIVASLLMLVLAAGLSFRTRRMGHIAA